MEKKVRRILHLALALILVAAVVLGTYSYAAPKADVIYERLDNGQNGFKFSGAAQNRYTDTDLFADELKGVMPGDEITQTISILNNTRDVDRVYFYLKAVPHDDGSGADANPLSAQVSAAGETAASMADFLSQLHMEIYNGGTLIYSSTPDQPGDLADYKLLGSAAPDEILELTLTLTVPIELGNEYANRVGEVDWVFRAEELDPVPDDPTPPTPPVPPVPPVPDEEIDITDEDVPLAAIGLNMEDHYAYISGYPDGTVRPLGKITRAEVATIFFRLLTDETRAAFWSQENDYSDVDSEDWYNNAVSTLTNMGILTGYPDGTFRPDAGITRAEFVKIAVGFFDYEDVTYDGRFSDVADGQWFTEYVAAAVSVDLIQGDSDGRFRPNDGITRAESCAIVNRVLLRMPHEDHLLPEEEMITWPDNDDRGFWFYADIQEATNSHDYEIIGPDEDHDHEQAEQWTARMPERDWPALEREWADAYDAPGGQVLAGPLPDLEG